MDKKQTWAVMLVVISVILGVLGFFGVLGAVANSMGGFRDAVEERGATLAGYAFLAAIPMFIVGATMYGNQVRWKIFQSPEIPFWTDVDDDYEAKSSVTRRGWVPGADLPWATPTPTRFT